MKRKNVAEQHIAPEHRTMTSIKRLAQRKTHHQYSIQSIRFFDSSHASCIYGVMHRPRLLSMDGPHRNTPKNFLQCQNHCNANHSHFTLIFIYLFSIMVCCFTHLFDPPYGSAHLFVFKSRIQTVDTIALEKSP